MVWLDNFENRAVITFDALSENEGFARIAAAAFISRMDAAVSDVEDIKTCVSEAVTNAIIHGYDGKSGEVRMTLGSYGGALYIEVADEGSGIDDVAKAMQPLYTSRPELERSGMGFTVMETFMDEIEVISEAGSGSRVRMIKKLRREENKETEV